MIRYSNLDITVALYITEYNEDQGNAGRVEVVFDGWYSDEDSFDRQGRSVERAVQ
jgi:hypothetical protein